MKETTRTNDDEKHMNQKNETNHKGRKRIMKEKQTNNKRKYKNIHKGTNGK